MSAGTTCKVTTTQQTWALRQGTREEVVAQLQAQGWERQGVVGDRVVLTHPSLPGTHTVVQP